MRRLLTRVPGRTLNAQRVRTFSQEAQNQEKPTPEQQTDDKRSTIFKPFISGEIGNLNFVGNQDMTYAQWSGDYDFLEGQRNIPTASSNFFAMFRASRSHESLLYTALRRIGSFPATYMPQDYDPEQRAYAITKLVEYMQARYAGKPEGDVTVTIAENKNILEDTRSIPVWLFVLRRSKIDALPTPLRDQFYKSFRIPLISGDESTVQQEVDPDYIWQQLHRKRRSDFYGITLIAVGLGAMAIFISTGSLEG